MTLMTLNSFDFWGIVDIPLFAVYFGLQLSLISNLSEHDVAFNRNDVYRAEPYNQISINCIYLKFQNR
jgi:hypothetical protein